ncbi:MAG TPA: glutamyl-tRNA reductase [Candidatus Avipropionibacterium avicola]|uniref:Glutamyl-tRNA reductase n=1 Tax=Candidatus Avipropionibacterium avicola TaxID=2840701 RepID=A0A9D1GYR8_9ACTN|nr:glutamyl-tRNA reductase [Candidatus Avipropionibacterium avicola]
MSLFALSLSHRTASLDTLAAASLSPDAAIKLCHALVASDHIGEVTVMSTCNRVEVYAEADRFHAALSDVVAAMSQVSGLSMAELQQSCGVHYDEGVVAHAFAVAAGLDSVVPGEDQVLGQFREALALGQSAGTVGTALNALFQHGIRVGKRVRAETEIGRAGRSLVDAAMVQLAERTGSVSGRRVVVLGAGQMASAAARAASEAGARVTVVNRTTAKADRLAAELAGATSAPWSTWRDQLGAADVVITCTGAAEILIEVDDLTDSPVTALVDLAMPPDIAADVADLPGRHLVNLETLRVAAPQASSVIGVVEARQLVAEEISAYTLDRRARSVTPTVVALRAMADEVVSAELDRLDTRLADVDEAVRDEVRRTVHRVAHKLLHSPTVRVQEYAGDTSVDYAAALRALFALEQSEVDAVMSPKVH